MWGPGVTPRAPRPAYIYRIASIKTELNLINFITNGAPSTVSGTPASERTVIQL